MGEKDEEVRQALKDLRAAGVDFVTMGQYLQPTRRHMKVEEYVHPDKFDYWREEGERLLLPASIPFIITTFLHSFLSFL